MMSSNHEVHTARQNRFIVPLATAAGVLVILMVQHIVLGIADVSSALAFGTIDSVWQFLQPRGFLLDVVFALGVFLSLSFILPICAGLRFFPVVVRSIVASAAGSVLVFIAMLIIGVNNAIGGILGTQTGFQGNVAAQWVGSGVSMGGGYFANSTPLVILAGVVLWIWHERHPRETRVSHVATQV